MKPLKDCFLVTLPIICDEEIEQWLVDNFGGNVLNDFKTIDGIIHYEFNWMYYYFINYTKPVLTSCRTQTACFYNEDDASLFKLVWG